MGFDQIGVFNLCEMVDLICYVVIIVCDLGVQNLFGIMFVIGFGVELNVDMVIEWFEIVVICGYLEVNFNLVLIYGMGMIQGSYCMCGVVESLECVDSYLCWVAEFEYGCVCFIWDNEGFCQDVVMCWDNIVVCLGSEVVQVCDLFWEVWQVCLDEVEVDVVYWVIQFGCYLIVVVECVVVVEEDLVFQIGCLEGVER